MVQKKGVYLIINNNIKYICVDEIKRKLKRMRIKEGGEPLIKIKII